MIPLPHLSLIVLLLAIASWSMELQAGVITGLRPQKRLVFVKLSGSESQTLKRGDKVKIESIHDFSRGIVRGVRGRMARIKVVKIGVLSKNTKVKVVKKNKGRTATQVAESKARMRAHKDYGFNAGAGLVFNDTPGGNVDAFMNLSHNFHLGVRIALGQKDLTEDLESKREDKVKDLNIDRFQLTSSFVSAEGRWFMNESFYVAGGLGMRLLDTSFIISEDDSQSAENIHIRSGIAHFGIGNFWFFDSALFLGIEWAGVMIPFETQAFSNREEVGSPSQASIDISEESQNMALELGDEFNYQAALVQFGILF